MPSAARVRKLAVFALSHLDGMYSWFCPSGSINRCQRTCCLTCATKWFDGLRSQIQVAVRGSGMFFEGDLTGFLANRWRRKERR
jgi:hypothetical protein